MTVDITTTQLFTRCEEFLNVPAGSIEWAELGEAQASPEDFNGVILTQNRGGFIHHLESYVPYDMVLRASDETSAVVRFILVGGEFYLTRL